MTGLCAASKLDSKHVARHEILMPHHDAVMAGSISHFEFAECICTMHNDQHACQHTVERDINLLLVSSASEHCRTDLGVTRLGKTVCAMLPAKLTICCCAKDAELLNRPIIA